MHGVNVVANCLRFIPRLLHEHLQGALLTVLCKLCVRTHSFIKPKISFIALRNDPYSRNNCFWQVFWTNSVWCCHLRKLGIWWSSTTLESVRLDFATAIFFDISFWLWSLRRKVFCEDRRFPWLNFR